MMQKGGTRRERRLAIYMGSEAMPAEAISCVGGKGRGKSKTALPDTHATILPRIIYWAAGVISLFGGYGDPIPF
jgi:hypothetical protein